MIRSRSYFPSDLQARTGAGYDDEEEEEEEEDPTTDASGEAAGVAAGGRAKIMPSAPLHNPRLVALVTQYFFLPRVTPLEFLRREYSSLMAWGM